MTSIILPNLNHRHFLEERIKTIQSQSYKNWECIVIDGFSTDGSWEYFKQVASNDKRFKIFQFPANGVYDAWNKGINKASGEYIYIATSDDTMSSTFLEKMVKALDSYKNCDIAHCNLTVIDENSKKIEEWLNWGKVTYFGDLINKQHIRKAPHDGLLHFCYDSVYTSITQLLIRKDLFNKIGLFLTDKGVIADVEWNMRASLLSNTIHIPEFLATWRKHSDQVTSENQNTLLYKMKIWELHNIAFNRALTINENLKKIFSKKWFFKFPYYLFLLRKYNALSGKQQKIVFILKIIIKKPCLFIYLFIIYKKVGFIKPEMKLIEKILKNHKILLEKL